MLSRRSSDRAAAPAAKDSAVKPPRERRFLYPDARPSTLRRYRAASFARSWNAFAFGR